MRLAASVLAILSAASFARAADYVVDTFAGTSPEDPTTSAGLPLRTANGIAMEATGTLLVVDTGGNRVWRAEPGGRVELAAGTGVPGHGGDGGPAVAAELNSPRDVALGPNGSLFISDAGNRRIRVISADGTIDTLPTAPVDYGPEVQNPKDLRNPSSIAYDPDQRILYVCETGLLRSIDESGALHLMAGTGEIGLDDTGFGPTSRVSPQTVAVGPDGTVHFAQFGVPLIWTIDAERRLSILFDGRDEFVVDEHGGARWMSSSGALAFGPRGRLYFSDAPGGHVYRLESDRTVTPVTPTAPGSDPDRGPIYFPYDLVVTAQDDIYVSQFSKGVVRRMREGDLGQIVVGSPTRQGDGGPAADARLFHPVDVTFDLLGNLYIADRDNAVIRRVSPQGIIETFAGNGGRRPQQSFEGKPPDRVAIGFVMRVKADRDGVYFMGNRAVRVVRPDRSVAHVATIGTKQESYRLSGMLPDGQGGLYLSAAKTHRLWRVDPDQSTLTVVAGDGEDDFPAEGALATETSIRAAQDMTLDPDGNLYFIDRVAEIRRLTPDGILTTIAARPRHDLETGEPIDLDLPSLDWPRGLAWGPDDALYVADKTKVRRLRMEGGRWKGETIAGQDEPGFSGDGGPAREARFNDLWGLAFGPDGRLYVADRDNHRIRVLTPIEP